MGSQIGCSHLTSSKIGVGEQFPQGVQGTGDRGYEAAVRLNFGTTEYNPPSPEGSKKKTIMQPSVPS